MGTISPPANANTGTFFYLILFKNPNILSSPLFWLNGMYLRKSSVCGCSFFVKWYGLKRDLMILTRLAFVVQKRPVRAGNVSMRHLFSAILIFEETTQCLFQSGKQVCGKSLHKYSSSLATAACPPAVPTERAGLMPVCLVETQCLCAKAAEFQGCLQQYQQNRHGNTVNAAVQCNQRTVGRRTDVSAIQTKLAAGFVRRRLSTFRQVKLLVVV